MNEISYPLLTKLGITIRTDPVPHVTRRDLLNGLVKAKLSQDTFHKFFGCQTCYAAGPYPWDVEAVLQRMMNGRLTGTQLYPD